MWNLIDLDKHVEGQGDTIYEFSDHYAMLKFVDATGIKNFRAWFVPIAPTAP